jgi:hypothetical protein
VTDFSKERQLIEHAKLSHVVTQKELRQVFSQAQNDTEDTIAENSELCFTEFIEAVARLALAKWETDGLKFREKIDMALQAICGISDSLTYEEKAYLHPGAFMKKGSAGREAVQKGGKAIKKEKEQAQRSRRMSLFDLEQLINDAKVQ